MLLAREQSLVILVDVQEKLTPLVQDAARLVSMCQWVLEVATLMDVPVFVSEQYPQGLGATVEALQAFVKTENRLSKTHFSCAADATCWDWIEKTNRRHIVLIGIETHVCVLQTAMELQARHHDVFVIAEAVSSRSIEDKALALTRMQQQGVQIISREMMVFEWLRQSGTELFKTISKKYLR
ncbi:MAG: isochorismatase family protein [Gammaproteobacteria bacterium]|nr:isochorismatase family protein [Gammaproteobacteria bacterium]